ncbi:hypothetical protein [Streptomyces sp. NPDC055709]
MRASLNQLSVEEAETVEEHSRCATVFVLDRAGDAIGVPLELWRTGAWVCDVWSGGAGQLDGPTAGVVSAAAHAGERLLAWRIVGCGEDKVLCHTVLAFGGDGVLRRRCCKISRYGFGASEAAACRPERHIATVLTRFGTLCLITRHHRWFPAGFRLERVRLLARTGAEGRHGGVRHDGPSATVAPWDDVLAGTGDSRQFLTDEFGMGDVAAGCTHPQGRWDGVPVAGATRAC